MASTSSDSDATPGESASGTAAGFTITKPTIYFDGTTNRRHTVALAFDADLEISENGAVVASWHYDDLRNADGGLGTLRLKSLSALPLARLEISDRLVQTEIRARARFLDVDHGGGKQTFRIVAWSLAAIASIAGIVFFGVPFAAERLVPLIPVSFERRLGDMADNQTRAIFGRGTCSDPAGNAAFAKLVETLQRAGHVDMPLQTAILVSPVPNAFALPGGKIYLLNGLLQKANNADEIAGVIAHEMGHVVHRDQTRMLLENGSTAFIIGLLFGDITGSSAVIFGTRSLFQASYSRDAEANADAFAIKVMHNLGRSPAPMGELLFRITGEQGGRMIGILASHPLTEERRALMRREDRPATGPDILSAAEWHALKSVCHSVSAK
ncbi:MAG: M48 family metallopeptidase [Xanthobacteraceae bacterium]